MHRIGLPEVPGLVFLTAGTCCSFHGPLPIQDYKLAFCGSWTVTAMRLSPDARGQSDAGQSGSAQVPCFHQEYLAVPPCRGQLSAIANRHVLYHLGEMHRLGLPCSIPAGLFWICDRDDSTALFIYTRFSVGDSVCPGPLCPEGPVCRSPS